MIFLKTLTISFLILFTPVSSIAVVDNPFIQACHLLKEELLKLPRIDVTEESATGANMILNFEGRAKYIEENKEKLTNAVKKVKKAAKISGEEFIDDSEFIEIATLYTLSSAEPEKLKLFEEQALEFVDFERSIQLETVTKDIFRDEGTFRFFIDDKFWDNTPGQANIGDLIRESDYRSIFIQAVISTVYLQGGDPKGARKLFNYYRDGLQSGHAQYLDELIERYEDFFKEHDL